MLIALATQISTSPHRVRITQRVIAKFLDLGLVVLVAALLPYPAGPLLGFLYSLLADGMNFGPFRGQSVGKRLMRLQVVQVAHAEAGESGAQRRPASLRRSALRNAPVGVATFFSIIPVWGWLILILVGVPLMLIEVYLMATGEAGHRLGDAMGDTEVVEVEGKSKEPKTDLDGQV